MNIIQKIKNKIEIYISNMIIEEIHHHMLSVDETINNIQNCNDCLHDRLIVLERLSSKQKKPTTKKKPSKK